MFRGCGKNVTILWGGVGVLCVWFWGKVTQKIKQLTSLGIHTRLYTKFTHSSTRGFSQYALPLRPVLVKWFCTQSTVPIIMTIFQKKGLY